MTVNDVRCIGLPARSTGRLSGRRTLVLSFWIGTPKPLTLKLNHKSLRIALYSHVFGNFSEHVNLAPDSPLQCLIMGGEPRCCRNDVWQRINNYTKVPVDLMGFIRIMGQPMGSLRTGKTRVSLFRGRSLGWRNSYPLKARGWHQLPPMDLSLKLPTITITKQHKPLPTTDL